MGERIEPSHGLTELCTKELMTRRCRKNKDPKAAKKTRTDN